MGLPFFMGHLPVDGRIHGKPKNKRAYYFLLHGTSMCLPRHLSLDASRQKIVGPFVFWLAVNASGIIRGQYVLAVIFSKNLQCRLRPLSRYVDLFELLSQLARHK